MNKKSIHFIFLKLSFKNAFKKFLKNLNILNNINPRDTLTKTHTNHAMAKNNKTRNLEKKEKKIPLEIPKRRVIDYYLVIYSPIAS